VNAAQVDSREADEWRVEVALDEEEHGHSLGERLRALKLDDQARKRLGGSVIITRDGRFMFLYAWHEESAREAERVVRELMEADGLAGQVRLMRWHPIAEDWRPEEEPLPETDAELAKEEQSHKAAGHREQREAGVHPWEVVIDFPDLRSTLAFGHELEERGLPVKRRWKYVRIGAETEEAAIELGRQLEGEAPKGSKVGVRGNPEDMPDPAFVQLGSLKPGVMRDLGL
jgi:hypothetical protein